MEDMMFYFFLILLVVLVFLLHLHVSRALQRKKLIEDTYAYLDFMRQQKVDQLYGRKTMYDTIDEKENPEEH